MNETYMIIAFWGIFIFAMVYVAIRAIQSWTKDKKDNYFNRDDYTIHDFYLPKD